MQNNYIKLWFLVCSSFYIAFIILCSFSYTLNVWGESSLIEFRYERAIALISLIYFFILLVSSFQSNKVFWFLLPFVVLTVPNAVNSIFPGFYLTSLGERGNASFSFISHIDIYLISNLIINAFKQRKITVSKNINYKLLMWLCLFLTIGLLYKSIEITLKDKDFIYILNGAFHFRYLFLILLISYQLKSNVNERAFVNGLMFSIPFLAVEAFTSTFLGGVSLFGELKSGNFANNVFGNFLAFLFIYFYVLNKNMTVNSSIHRALLILLFVLIIMTGVRGAMFSLCLGLLAYFVFMRVSPMKIVNYLILLCLVFMGLLVALDLLWIFGYVEELFTSFQIVIEQGYGNDGIIVDENNSSLITRVAIWKGTFLMAMDNWFFGVGASQWNYLKEAYGIPFKVLLDPHNDYLNFFCLYGFSGLLFIYVFYIKPSAFIIFKKLQKGINPYQLALFTLSISSLTNANNSKHQVFVIVVVFLLLSINFQSNSIARGSR